jgi:alkanesulfonate monooxygenase
MNNQLPSLETFTTCPQSSAVARDAYLERVADVARWSEKQKCKGMLVYTDNSLVDAWLVSQIIVENTSTLCPLVAVQPVYMHPYAVAKMVASFAHLHGRRVYLNMVAGGFKNDLIALNDTTAHDRRYDRLVEYTTIVKSLLASPRPVSFAGEFYTVTNLRMTPPVPGEILPGVFISGSSAAGLSAARAIGATAIEYPKPADQCDENSGKGELERGIRIGIITREDEREAWAIAHERFPEDRKGQLTHQLAMKTSDSVWHRQLSATEREAATPINPYWLVPFENYKTFCPYLVGSYERVAQELLRYIALGYRTFIMDIPVAEEDLYHCNIAFGLARETVSA